MRGQQHLLHHVQGAPVLRENQHPVRKNGGLCTASTCDVSRRVGDTTLQQQITECLAFVCRSDRRVKKVGAAGDGDERERRQHTHEHMVSERFSGSGRRAGTGTR